MADTKMVRAWIVKAGKDYRDAKVLYDMGEDHFDNSAYLSQQSVEKSIKGYLAFMKKSFKKSHEIEYLVDLVETFDPLLSKKLSAAIPLTQYAIAARYPDAAEVFVMNESVAKEALQIAENIYQELSSRIKLQDD